MYPPFTMRSTLAGLLIVTVLSPRIVVADQKLDELKTRLDIIRAEAERERREFAKRVAETNKERIKDLEGRLEKIKVWSRAQFELAERDMIDKPRIMAPTLARWQKQRDTDKHRLLTFRAEIRGEIESGKALNKMLDWIGPMAHQSYQLGQLNAGDAPASLQPAATGIVDKPLCDHLVWQTTTLGSKASGRFNADPIDIDWPAVLMEKRWDSHRTQIENARKKVLDELKDGLIVSAAADERLRTSVESLNQEFAEYRRNYVRNGGSAGLGYRRICNGSRHIRKLVAAVYQVVEARDYEDVVPTQGFTGGTIEQLLSFMHERRLEFAPPADKDRVAYGRVFDMMVQYYLDVKSMLYLEERLENEVTELKRVNREATQVALGNSLSAADGAAVTIEGLRALSEFLTED